MTCPDPGPDDLSYPVCEQVRDLLITQQKTPRSQHFPRGPIPYYPYNDIIRVLSEKSHVDMKGKEISRGESVFICKCLKCQKQGGRQGGIDNRSSRWDDNDLLGNLATTYALLIVLRCPGLISAFRRRGYSLEGGYLSKEQLLFLDESDVLTAIQASNIRNEILSIQYQFRVSKFAKRNEVFDLDEKEILPIYEDPDAAGEGNFGEVYPFYIPTEYIGENLRKLETNKFARKIFKRLPTESKKDVKEFVIQQLESNTYQHPNLMEALAAFEHGRDCFFILFEFAPSTLYKFLIGDGPVFSPQELWKQVAGLSSGLAHLHSKGVIHRDLKPANILILKGVMKIADFGFASYNNPWLLPTDESPTGSLIPEGINHYSPPPSDKACAKYDVYSLGAIMSEIASFDIGNHSRLAGYRQSRLDDAGEKHTPSRRFYYQEGYEMKVSVHEEHSSLVKTIQDESRDPQRLLHPWREFFYHERFFHMICTLLHPSKVVRPTAAEVVDMLSEHSKRADMDTSQNKNDRNEHHLVNDLLESLVDDPPGLAELGNRFIASFEGKASKGTKRCGLWLYPKTNEIKMLRFEYSLDKSGPHLVERDGSYVNRKQKKPYTGIKPAYIEDSYGNSVCLMDPEEPLIYTFSRLSDTLRFQGIMTGETVYKYMSFQLTDFSLRKYRKSTSSTSIPFLSRGMKSKDTKQIITGGPAHIQIWIGSFSAVPIVKLAILSKEKLYIVKVTSQYIQYVERGLTKTDTPLSPAVARLGGFPETRCIDMSEGIPFFIEPQKYDSHDEVRLYFADENDTKNFWRNLEDVKREIFPVESSGKPESSKSSILSRRDTGGSQGTARSPDTIYSQETKKESVEYRRDSRRINTLPANH